MTQETRRDRARAETDRDIRAQARALLVSDGPQAVTLRAIARELGITAPALYRYYGSREDLIEHLRADVCADLAAELDRDLAGVAESDHLAQVLAVCRGFRRWALTHPQEFTLVFATPPRDRLKDPVRDSFGRIFLGVAARILAVGELITPPDIPAALAEDLSAFRSDVLDMMTATGVSISDSRLSVGTAYVMLRFWVRLYGQVALEVFGQLPFPVTDAEPIFESMLKDLVGEVGLSA